MQRGAGQLTSDSPSISVKFNVPGCGWQGCVCVGPPRGVSCLVRLCKWRFQLIRTLTLHPPVLATAPPSSVARCVARYVESMLWARGVHKDQGKSISAR